MRKNIVIVKRPVVRRSTRRLRLKPKKKKNVLLLFDIVENPVEFIVCCIILIIILVLYLIYGKKENGFSNNVKKTIKTVKNKMKKNSNNSNNSNNINNKNNNKLVSEEKEEIENNKKENTVKIIVESSYEPKKQKNLSYFQYQDLKAHERLINPLLPPKRSMENSYGIPINVPTRGEVGSFQQIGALYKETIDSDDMTPGNNTDSVVLALFGKQTYPRSQKWTYYTSSDRNHQVKMPLSNKGRKCDSQYGCEEIVNDDLITVPGYNGVFRAVIYDYDAPKYIPCV